MFLVEIWRNMIESTFLAGRASEQAEPTDALKSDRAELIVRAVDLGLALRGLVSVCSESASGSISTASAVGTRGIHWGTPRSDRSGFSMSWKRSWASHAQCRRRRPFLREQRQSRLRLRNFDRFFSSRRSFHGLSPDLDDLVQDFARAPV